jgi:pimeloyl-ACP methyl ester carboxylesterase
MVTEARTAPVVIFSPGFSASYSFYQAYFTHLASHGYAVLAMNTLGSAIAFDSQHDDKASQILAALDYVIAPERSWSDQLDDTRIATAGHSMGAKLAFYAASLDARISVVLALDPVNAGGPPCFIAPDDCRRYPVAANPESGQLGKLAALQAASLILRSEPDKSTNPDPQFNAQWFFLGLDGQGEQAVPSPALYVDMGAVRHADYLTLLTTDSNAPTHRLAKGYMLAWLQQEFEQQQFEQPPLEQQDYEDYFSGATAQGHIDAGYIVSSQRR